MYGLRGDVPNVLVVVTRSLFEDVTCLNVSQLVLLMLDALAGVGWMKRDDDLCRGLVGRPKGASLPVHVRCGILN